MNEWDLYARLKNEYNQNFSYNGVDGDRLAQRLHAISEIGLTENEGSYRLEYSKEEKQAKELVIGWMKITGLAVSDDGAI